MRANYYIGILSVLMLAGSTVNAQTADSSSLHSSSSNGRSSGRR